MLRNASLCVLAALLLAPAAQAQKRIKDEALHEYLIQEFARLNDKLDKLAARLATDEADIAQIKQQLTKLGGDLLATQEMVKATDSSITSHRVDSQQDLINLKTAVAQIQQSLAGIAEALRKSAAAATPAYEPAPAPAPATTAAPAPASPAPGYVTAANDTEVSISLGSKDGVRVGMKFNVFKASDPQQQVGVIEITEVLDANNSHAKVLFLKSGSHLEFSDPVRPF